MTGYCYFLLHSSAPCARTLLSSLKNAGLATDLSGHIKIAEKEKLG